MNKEKPISVFSSTEVLWQIVCTICGKSLHREQKFFIFEAEKIPGSTGPNHLFEGLTFCCDLAQQAPVTTATEEDARNLCETLNNAEARAHERRNRR
jgi:hypothetical protein